MIIRLGRLFLLILFLAVPAYGDEIIITFDSQTQQTINPIPSYTESGFTFCCNVRLMRTGPGSNLGLEINSNHITAPRTVGITFMGGGTFDFLGVDWMYGYGRDVFRASNGVVIDFNPSVGFGTLFHGITWLDWVHYGTGGEPGPAPVNMDNFRFNTHTNTIPTPEPATLILLGSGLLGVLKAAKKKGKA